MIDPGNFRIGEGYDSHRLTPGRKLILGGVEIEFEKGLLGHSDADVLIHAMIDSLLGAMGTHDIGGLFPDTDPQYSGISSIRLLERVKNLMKESGFRLINIDSTIIAQRPKLAPHIPRMKINIAQSLGVDTDQIGIKAKTAESMGFAGREEGMEARAVCMLLRCHKN